ncbi:type I-B CRISPR-associated protein Cas5b [Methylomusa anaerophila]|uniref:CRISPR-associated protein n=1 Tax=Methylomusa anaerophila TaxID=1930071 RepID=A0A348AR35_9FIRM|nr:type I-B CRISPR-associated protein Cas5b [Methylomusa anaerophila]BBB93533.1 CRISPR-associated protein [Methylomusa anaerophila]
MAIAFEVSGPVAMFRRPYTTTSSVSFPFPPPTAIAGVLTAVCGHSNGSGEEASAAKYWQYLRGTRVAISLLNPIAWYSATLNFWNVKNPQQSPHIQVKHQFVKNPRYRIYVEGGLETELQGYLEQEAFVYTPYLGVAYAISDIYYCGVFAWEPVTNDNIAIHSILPQPAEQSFKVDIVATGGLFKERVPFQMTADRALAKSMTVLYPTSPQRGIHLTAWEGLDVTRYGDSCIAWFPAW